MKKLLLSSVMVFVFLFLVFCGCVETENFVNGSGIIQFNDFEGGFYGIVADDGEKYDPLNFPSDFEVDGLRVVFSIEVLKDQVSVHQWGIVVNIVDIDLEEDFNGDDIEPEDNKPPTDLLLSALNTSFVDVSNRYKMRAYDSDVDDMIRYVIDWNDGSNITISDFLKSGESFVVNHTWAVTGLFTIEIYAEDLNGARSDLLYFDILIVIENL